jgi:DNA polymerase elongation subunit (family B)
MSPFRPVLKCLLTISVFDVSAQCSAARSKADGRKLAQSSANASANDQNVTYGYTSATYSGRMPCIEIADSIVQTGRETLEKVSL